MVDLLLFFALACIPILAVLLFVLYKQKIQDEKLKTFVHSSNEGKVLIDKAMKNLNCYVTWEKDGGNWKGKVEYQSAVFHIKVEKNNPYVGLYYLFFFETTLANVETVRALCNQCNMNSDSCRLVYSVSESDSAISVHIFSEIPYSYISSFQCLAQAMQNAFKWQKVFESKFLDVRSSSNVAGHSDPEKDAASASNELYLLREMEMTHQDEGPNWHEQPEKPLTLRSLAATTMDLQDLVPVELTVFQSDKTSHYDGFEDILDFSVAQALIANDKFHHDYAVLRLDFYDPRNAMALRHLVVDLQSQGTANGTLYYRATLCLAPAPLDKDIPLNNNETHKRTTSVLLGYDTTHGCKNKEKFDYMWKEALGKHKSGNDQKLTDDERTLLLLRDPHIQQLYLRGRDLMTEKRYYEAVRCLEAAFNGMVPLHPGTNNKIAETFYRVSYLIGTCYVCLRQFKKAEYFLEITLPMHHITYTEMYVNALVGGHDYRALDFVNEMLNSIYAAETVGSVDSEKAEARPWNPFVSFLKRRKAYLLIEMARYDEAERLLKQMLDEADSSDFALLELAFIQKKKGK